MFSNQKREKRRTNIGEYYAKSNPKIDKDKCSKIINEYILMGERLFANAIMQHNLSDYNYSKNNDNNDEMKENKNNENVNTIENVNTKLDDFFGRYFRETKNIKQTEKSTYDKCMTEYAHRYLELASMVLSYFHVFVCFVFVCVYVLYV